ncbi:Uma2 family endonuclease [uncultured Thermus sp.]|uniref:Uma2 family endonuclease n=1 Tax=uncultured Thermus sp. TaxID=157149 RepID=UPI0026338045|nr:Uma2 family endonuclease [uncultured Thermus sp.]
MLRYRFSAEDFHRMAEAGILPEDARVELVEGEVVNMSPIGKRHVYALNALVDLLSPLVGKAVLSVQNPLVLGPATEVYPDLTLLRPPRSRYRDRLPEAQDALLVVEVAEASREYDLGVKVPLYAQAGIPEVWLVDLLGHQVQVFRKPGESTYGENILAEGELEILGLKIPVKEVLP